MNRTLIRFQEDDGGKVLFHLEEPRGVANGRRLVALKSLPSDDEFRMAAPNPEVHKAGMRLRDDLLSHAAVKAGYTKVYWFRGGLPEWRAAGLKVVQDRCLKVEWMMRDRSSP